MKTELERYRLPDTTLNQDVVMALAMATHQAVEYDLPGALSGGRVVSAGNGGFYITGAEIYQAVKAVDNKIDKVEETLAQHIEQTVKTFAKLEIKFYGVLAALMTTIVAELLLIAKLIAEGNF